MFKPLFFNFLTRNKYWSQKYPDPNNKYRTGLSQRPRPLLLQMSESSLWRPLCFYRFCSWCWRMGLQVESADCGKKQTVHFMPHLLLTHPLSISWHHSASVHIDAACKFHEIKLAKPSVGKLKYEHLKIFNLNIFEEHYKIHVLWDKLI